MSWAQGNYRHVGYAYAVDGRLHAGGPLRSPALPTTFSESLHFVLVQDEEKKVSADAQFGPDGWYVEEDASGVQAGQPALAMVAHTRVYKNTNPDLPRLTEVMPPITEVTSWSEMGIVDSGPQAHAGHDH